MTTFYTIDRANARVPEVRELLLLLRAQRGELIELRDRLVTLAGDEGDRTAADDRGDEAAEPAPSAPGDPSSPRAEPAAGGDPASGHGAEEGATLTGLEQAELIRLRIRGIVDQMGASVARLDGWGITLRDIESGLVDFPALVSGRQVWLCWRLGEGDVAWWHELDTGFGGRRRLVDLE